MAEGSKESRKDQIRVVDEVPTEVVRLDVERVELTKKKGVIPEVLIAPVMESTPQENSSEEDPVKEKLLDPETEWLEFDNKSDDDSVPMGWFVLLGVGLFGVLGWVIFQTNMGDGRWSVTMRNPSLCIAATRIVPSGSDHMRSHMGPSCGTSCFRAIVLI